MEDGGMPLAIGIIIGAAVLGTLILAGLVVAAVLAI
jgi:outer membrane murein-binding lipoprotein Lpp